MKTTIWIFLALAFFMVGFNLFQVQWEAPFSRQNTVAWIGVLASACAAVILLIFRASKKIEAQKDNS